MAPKRRSGACTGAGGATFLAVNAIVGAKFRFEMERQILAFFMLVSNDIMRACHNTPGTACAKTCVDDFGFEFFPLRCPAGWSGRLFGRAHSYNVGDAQVANVSGMTEFLDR